MMAPESVLIPLAGLVRPTLAKAEIIDDPMVERFSFLFAGRTDVWGAVHGQAIKAPVTITHYRNHLAGKTSLDIYPLTPQGLVRWFAIDIDKQDPALALRLLAALRTLGLSQAVYLERSKGKGFHIIILLSDWVLAIQARRIARAALIQAGLPATTEIFPKQDQLTQDTPWGNYLNLPYFAGDNPEGRRMVVDPGTLTPVPLRIWLEEVKPFPVDALPAVVNTLPAKPEVAVRRGTSKAEILAKLSGTQEPGMRRPTLVSLAGYLRCHGVAEDVAVELLLPWAREHFKPPLPDTEVETHIRGIYRRYGIPAIGCYSPRRAILPTVEVGP
jgi:hypothetical protein